ncbi:hypothetical protein Tco_0354726, partial [Tanacetum coccineum]
MRMLIRVLGKRKAFSSSYPTGNISAAGSTVEAAAGSTVEAASGSASVGQPSQQ